MFKIIHVKISKSIQYMGEKDGEKQKKKEEQAGQPVKKRYDSSGSADDCAVHSYRL